MTFLIKWLFLINEISYKMDLVTSKWLKWVKLDDKFSIISSRTLKWLFVMNLFYFTFINYKQLTYKCSNNCPPYLKDKVWVVWLKCILAESTINECVNY